MPLSETHMNTKITNPRWFEVTDQQIQVWSRTAPDLHTAAAAWVHQIEASQVTPELRKEAKLILFGRVYGLSITNCVTPEPA